MSERSLLLIEDESKSFPSFTAYGGATTPYIHRRGPDLGETSQYDLFFTDSRIIAAVVVSTYDLPPLIMSYEDIKPIRKWKKIRDEMRQKFKNSTPDEILHMHPESFEIHYDKIKEIKLKKGTLKAKLNIKAILDEKIEEKIFPIPKSRFKELETFIHDYVKLSTKFIQMKEG